MVAQKPRLGCLGVVLWPVIALSTLLAAMIKVVGRAIAFVLGFVLMIFGVVLCLTIIGAIVGVPRVLFGLALVVRGLF